MSEHVNVDEVLKDYSEPQQSVKKVSGITKFLVGLFSVLVLAGCSAYVVNNYEKLFNLSKVDLEDQFLINDLHQASIGFYYNGLLENNDYDTVLDLMIIDEDVAEEYEDYHMSSIENARHLSLSANLKYQLKLGDEVTSNFTPDVQGDLNEDINSLTEDHLLVAQISFDSKGEPTVSYVQGLKQEFFEENYNSVLSHEGIGIKDATLTLAIPNYLQTYDWLYYSVTHPVYQQMAMLLVVYLVGLGSVIGLIVLFTPYRILSQLGILKLVDKVPVELNSVAVVGAIVFQAVVATEYLIPLSVSGEVKRVLIEELMMGADQATIITVAINMIFWMVFFGFIYVGVYIIKTLFVKGLFRFIKEHSFIYKTLNWIRKSIMRTMKWVFSVDLKQKHSKKLLAFVGINFIVLSVMCAMWFFGIMAAVIYSVALYVVIDKVYKKIRADYETLVTDIQTLADGRLDVELDDNYGVFNDLKDELLEIQSGFKHAVSKEVKSQNMKTELIANVSHDLKTPLTSIVTYIDLLKDDTLEESKQKEYLEIIDRKADRLKVLIEDLFEMSKASSGDITLNVEEVNIVSLLKQTVFELEDCLKESEIVIRQNYSDEKVKLMLDPLRTYRIFENLVLNISKYSMPRSRAYIEVVELDTEVQVIFKNISAEEITVNAEDLKERFVRGDEARHTEGSGLGLAICKTFVELQNGTFDILVDGDLFKTVIKFKK